MPNEWSDWAPFEDGSGDPYVTFRDRTFSADERDRFVARKDLIRADLRPLTSQRTDAFTQRIKTDDGASAYSDETVLTVEIEAAIMALNAPIPKVFANPKYEGSVQTIPDDVIERLPTLKEPDKTVIMGVIDVGIPLGHKRLRNCDGETRILAAWQQMTRPSEGGPMPFGDALFQNDIDKLIMEHSGGSRTGWLDEESFNRATGVVNMTDSFGEREAAGGTAHGAHVLDLAAGCDPFSECKFAESVKIIVVNVPSIGIVGNSGEYLDGFVIQAYQWIIAITKAIREQSKSEKKDVSPLIINMSLGRQAGPKISAGTIPALLQRYKDELIADEAIEEQIKNHPSKLNFVMPVGNDNLTRCNAILEPKPHETVTLDWRVHPEDQSPNFVEVWTSPPEGVPDLLLSSGTSVSLSLIAPDGTRSRFLETDHIQNLVSYNGRAAAIFREFKVFGAEGGTQVTQVRHVLCLGPTHRADNDRETVVAGVWRVEITNNTEQQIQCVCAIQTDQGLLPSGGQSKRSYFDDPNYVFFNAFDGMGDMRETYAYPEQTVDNLDLLAHPETREVSAVKRHGTVNATAVHNSVARIAGYRASDGRPAFYSSTGYGRRPEFLGASFDTGTVVRTQTADASLAPTVAFPTEDSPFHQGILAAGAADGSVKAMRGTSFAAPQAARLIAQELLDAQQLSQNDSDRLWKRAEELEYNRNPNPEAAHLRKHFSQIPRGSHLIEVMGRGRIECPAPRVVSRFEKGD